MRIPPRTLLARVAAAAFGLTAAFHVLALVCPSVSEPSPAWRHALFVVVNLGYAVAFAVRPPWLLIVYLPLAIQQSFSHGAAFARACAVGHTDWQSAVVLATVPIFGWVAYCARR